ncbi:hypothetical protein Z948_3550 [Sulfitobacter donghicola DSW-25 = KCTC 12864 = JCM 14565]|nr:hypothetical protein Z948_3550 [Sulfitobacter donghicola DSW-25 = KCTC 12864 = JCM 14565]
MRSTGEACLPLMDVLAWIRDQLSETGARVLGTSPFPFGE